MQAPRGVRPPLGVIFDSDIGERIDTVLALAMLYGFDQKNEARVVCVSVGKNDLSAAAYCDAVGRFYAAGGFVRTLPVGMSTVGKSAAVSPMLSGPLSKKTPDGQPVYKHGITDINDTAEVTAVIRNAYTAQHDANCVTVLAGPATNLASVLKLPGAKELILKKVKLLAISGGPHLGVDVAAAKQLFAEWPGQIVVSQDQIGNELRFPADSIERDFAWSQAHPVVDAYRAYKTMPYDAPTSDMSVVLYAVRPQEGYSKLSEPGKFTMADDGRIQFTALAEGRHRQLLFDSSQKEKILKTYTEIASIKPVPRRFFRPQQQQQQQQPPQTPAGTALQGPAERQVDPIPPR